MDGTYIRWQLRNRCLRKEQSLLFQLVKAFDQIESSRKSEFFTEDTERSMYYRKSVLHLLKHIFHIRLRRCSRDLRQYTVHPVPYNFSTIVDNSISLNVSYIYLQVRKESKVFKSCSFDIITEVVNEWVRILVGFGSTGSTTLHVMTCAYLFVPQPMRLYGRAGP